MREHKDKYQSRRAALTTFLRWGAGGILAGGGGFLLAERSTLGNPDKCIANGFCENCGLWDNCDLPRAQLNRNSTRD